MDRIREIFTAFHQHIMQALPLIGAAIFSPDTSLHMLWLQNANLALLVCFFVIFLETGCIFFPFLPGDFFLIVVGGVAAKVGAPSIHAVVGILILAAFLGALVNHLMGRLMARFFSVKLRRYNYVSRALDRAEIFYKKHGPWALVLSRGVGWARTFVPFFSGVCGMPMKEFLYTNLLGAGLWAAGFAYIGAFVPGIERIVGTLIPIGTFLPLFLWAACRIATRVYQVWKAYFSMSAQDPI